MNGEGKAALLFLESLHGQYFSILQPQKYTRSQDLPIHHDMNHPTNLISQMLKQRKWYLQYYIHKCMKQGR